VPSGTENRENYKSVGVKMAVPHASAELSGEAHQDQAGGQREHTHYSNPNVDYCLTRLGVLAAQSRALFEEMRHLCNLVNPELWASGNVPGARFVGTMEQMAANAVGNTAYLEHLASSALATHYERN
jgi:hypothetical protein